MRRWGGRSAKRAGTIGRQENSMDRRSRAQDIEFSLLGPYISARTLHVKTRLDDNVVDRLSDLMVVVDHLSPVK